jgi:hypothetical protein
VGVSLPGVASSVIAIARVSSKGAGTATFTQARP